jgi:DNA-binding IclR family transcriptional regulator
MSVAVRVRAAELLSHLADENRLLILATLTRHAADGATLTEIGEELGLPLAKVGDACARLVALGVAHREGNRFHARLAGFREAAGDLDALHPISALLSAYPKLRGSFSHGRLVSMPALGDGYAQLAEMLARFVDLPGEVDEAEVNRRLRDVSDDVAKLRRMLVDLGWLVRDRAGRTYRAGTPESVVPRA